MYNKIVKFLRNWLGFFKSSLNPCDEGTRNLVKHARGLEPPQVGTEIPLKEFCLFICEKFWHLIPMEVAVGRPGENCLAENYFQVC